nr:ribonuclease H-like domain-containing protein [Tanacetum cinerariifolium]
SEYIMLGKDFKLKDDTNVLLMTPRQHNMYSIDLNNIVPHKNLTCLVAKASIDERNFDAKGDEGYFVGYSMSNKSIQGTKDVASQDVKKDVSSLRYFALPNWFHDAHMETRNSDAPDGCNANDPESSGISNLTATLKVSSSDQVDPIVSLTVESKIPTVSSPVPTVYQDISPKSSSGPRLITKGDFSQKETPSLGNALTLSNMFKDTFEVEADLNTCKADAPKSSGNPNPTATTTNPPAGQMETLTVETPIPTVSSPVLTACLNDSPEPSNILGVTTNSDESNGVEADVSKLETTITASPTLTLRIHKDHLKSQIIGHVDTPIQTKNKSKEMEEQSFIATIHQKTNPALLQSCLFSCFLS